MEASLKSQRVIQPHHQTVVGYLNSKQAALFKRMIWEAMNKDYDKDCHFELAPEITAKDMRERRGLCTSRERTLLELRAWETMKRFFRPVEKDGSAKKPTLSSSSENGEISGEGSKKEPLKFITWNANSFLLQVKKNWPEFTKFITSFDPDVIAIQASHSFSFYFPTSNFGLFSFGGFERH
ncbi:unnamed protein product [Prunus armeniaca]